MRTIVIGGKGHIGTYLVPRLVEAGHEVVVVTRGKSKPYRHHGAWDHVKDVVIDRKEEEKAGSFGAKVAALSGDVVVDLINFQFESTPHIVDALRGKVEHYLYCSSIWAHGAATVVPAPESLPRHPFGDYGINKAKSEAYLHAEHRRTGFPETVVMPGHITGAGWSCINPSGNLDPQVFGRIARGEEIYIPNLGMETVHHVHADDVAQVFMNAIIHRNRALGESFHAVAPAAMTLRGFAESVAGWFAREPVIKYLPWKEWCEVIKDEGFITSTWNHIAHSDNYSIEKGRRLIDYNPRYSILQAVYESVSAMIESKVIHI
jgi:nucleoside-diphosphate-sugar epimerase